MPNPDMRDVVVTQGPERIWLHGYGSDYGEVTWCDDPNPSGEPEEAESAVAYIRVDAAEAECAARVEALEEVTLAECPPGLFWAGGTLGMKSEYGDNSGRIDAFIVESGEFLWGPAPQTIARQRAMLVRPIAYDAARAALDTKGPDHAAG